MLAHTKAHRVQWGETDAAGIVFYPNYFRWFDQATHDMLREAGCPISGMLERGFAVIIVDSAGRFTSPLAYEDRLTIVSRVAEVRTRAFRVEHEISRGDDIVCRGYEVRMWVALAGEGRQVRAEPIPDDLRASLLGGAG